MPLEVSIRSVDGIDLLRAEGEIDFGTAERFDEALQTLVLDRVGEVLVDMRNVGFMDSTGIHHLIAAQRRLAVQGRQFVVVCAHGPVHDVFEATGLLEQLCVHETGGDGESALS
jgi:anti-sigma B factor antagonist